MVNHCPMTEATIRLDVQGDVARMTFDRPHVLNAGNSRFATELGEAVASINARRDVRVVVMTGAGRAFQTGVDLKALAAGELTQPDLVRWEDAMTEIERHGQARHRGDQRALHRRRPPAGARVRLPAGRRGRAAQPAGRQGMPDSVDGRSIVCRG